MKISVNVINKYLEKKLSTEEMAYALEKTEVEVEDILYSAKLDPKVIVGEIIGIENHPNADKLKLVDVQMGSGMVKVVCGAPNVRVGMKTAFAQVGSVLPEGMIIKEAMIRGEHSHGMLCSEKELGWGDSHDGVVDLDPSLPCGKSLCDIVDLSDTLDIKTPTNRWDYTSYIGLAREISATQKNNSLIEDKLKEIEYRDSEAVKINTKDECKAFYSVKLRIKNNEQSPKWLVESLESSGVRSVNPVVDITNFVMLEYGQPSHAYDLSKINGRLQVRYAKKEEKMTTLDGKELKLSEKDLVIADDSGAVALAGVMGSRKTGVTSKSREIFLEVANFDKTTVRRAAIRNGLRTEASARFEKGLPLPLSDFAFRRIIDLLVEVCGAEIVSVPNRQIFADYHNIFLGMRVRKAEKFLGYKLDSKEVVNELNRRGFKPSQFSFSKEIKLHLNKPYMYGAQLASEKLDKFDCSLLTQHIYSKAGVSIGRTAQMQFEAGMEVPTIALKPGDLLFLKGDEKKSANKIGHVGMYVGSNKVLQASSTQKKVLFSPVSKFLKADNYAGARRYVENFNHIITVEVPWWRNDVSKEVDLFEEVAKYLGYDLLPETLPSLESTETQNHQLLPSLMTLKYRLSSAGMDEIMTYSFVSYKEISNISDNVNGYLKIENPLSMEQEYLRKSLLPSHLKVISSNIVDSRDEISVYEISKVYSYNDQLLEESWVLGLSICGKDSLLKLKGIIDKIFGWYRIANEVERLKNNSVYIEGRSGINKTYDIKFGQIRDDILDNFEITSEVSFAQINLGKIFEEINRPIETKDPIPYQLVRRDLSFDIDSTALYGEVKKFIKDLCYSIDYKGEYHNEELDSKNLKRLNISVTLDLGPTPKADDINNSLTKINKCLIDGFKAKIIE